MKRRNHGWLVGLALVLVLCCSLMLSVVSASASSAPIEEPTSPKESDKPVEEESRIVVWTDSTNFEYKEGAEYWLPVYASGCFSSFQMTLGVPGFMNVTGVVCEWEGGNNVFEYNVNNDMNSIALTFSSPNEYYGGMIFRIGFTLREGCDGASDSLWLIDSAIFTNPAFETIYADTRFGSIRIGGYAAKGDFNGDGYITLDDVILMQRAIVGLIDFDDQKWYSSDINNDGNVNIVDVQYVQMYLIGAIGSLEDIEPQQSGFQINVVVFTKGGSYVMGRTFYGDETRTYGSLLDEIFNALSGENPYLDYNTAVAESGVDLYDGEVYLSQNDTIFIYEVIYSISVRIVYSDGGWNEFRYGGDEEETYASMYGFICENLESYGKFGDLDYANATTESGESVFDETKHLYRD